MSVSNKGVIGLQNQTFLVLLLLGQESCTCSVLENFTDTLVGLGGTLKILVGPNLLSDFLALLWANRLLACFVEFLNGLLVETEILLAANEDDRETLAEMEDFRNPLFLDVIKGIG